MHFELLRRRAPTLALEKLLRPATGGIHISPSLSNQLTAFFESLGYKLDAQREAARQIDLYLSTSFNPLNYLAPDENTLSRILQDLLSPTGTHGQGSKFLDAFLKANGFSELVGQLPTNVGLERVTRHLPRSRRIDLVIEFKTYAIGIENKPWARDQRDQVSDYQRNLGLAFGNRYHLMYLTGTRREPESYLDLERLRLMSYSQDITAWITECERLCESDKFKWFLRDFRAYVQREFPGGVEDESE